MQTLATGKSRATDELKRHYQLTVVDNELCQMCYVPLAVLENEAFVLLRLTISLQTSKLIAHNKTGCLEKHCEVPLLYRYLNTFSCVATRVTRVICILLFNKYLHQRFKAQLIINSYSSKDNLPLAQHNLSIILPSRNEFTVMLVFVPNTTN